MAIPNRSLCYRPVRAGTTIVNPKVARVGTIGLVGTSDGKDRWIISCYHVLCRIDFGAFSDAEPIYQPIDDPENLIARTSISRASADLDCAAARLESDIESTSEVLEMPPVIGIIEPVVGMRVIKSGCITGVTEGVISKVDGDAVEILPPSGFPSWYELSQEGDSGAMWVSSRDGKAVALHRAGNAYGKQISLATRMSTVLTSLNLQMI